MKDAVKLYKEVSFSCSELITKRYSTSFSLGISTLHKSIHKSIYAVYGFVRFADEIVDTFHDLDKEKVLNEFERDTYDAIKNQFSTNPVLHSFQYVVNKHKINKDHIVAFLKSMRMDLSMKVFSEKSYKEYIYGSAEVVGLMCLKVFCDEHEYEKLEEYAISLGSAFQKVNFLRDLKADKEVLNRTYFPNTKFEKLSEPEKNEIINEIEDDFKMGLEGIKELPLDAKFGVFMAYRYYYQLLKKLKKTPATEIIKRRIRVPNLKKIELLTRSYVKYQLNLL